MRTLTNTDTLNQIVNSINELILSDENTQYILDNFRNLETTISDQDYKSSSLKDGVIYKINTIGVYNIEFLTTTDEKLQVYINNNRNKDYFRFELNKDDNKLENIFLTVGDTIFLQGENLSDSTTAKIVFSKNIFKYIIDITDKTDKLDDTLAKITEFRQENEEFIQSISSTLDSKADKKDIPTKLSQFEQDEEHTFLTFEDKQRLKKIDDKEDSLNKGIPNGYASLDGLGKVPKEQLPEMDLHLSLSDLQEDTKHRTVTDDEKTNWNEKLSTVAGKDITKGQTKGYENTKTWEVVSRSRELGEWIGDLDARTRSLNKESIKTVNGLRPDASGNLKLVIDPYPTDPVVGFNVKSGTNSFELTWTNPKNLDFEGVKIVKNYEHYPANVDDGIEVLDSYGSKNTQKFTDTKIRKGMYTYYRIFPFDYHRNYNMDSGQVGTGLIKDEQEPPSPPTLKEASYETVTLNSVVGIEFSIDGSRWQTSNVFNNLNSNTSYTFYARKAGTTFLNPSPKSAGLTVKTKIPPFDDKIGSPGNRKLLKGTMEQGWFGEVSASDFISGDELAKKVGITAGTSQNSNGGWLKFAYMGKVEFVAKKTIRYGISWDSINNANAVTGERTIEIGGKTYKIRLMKGKTEGKQNDSSSYEGDINKGSEWNRLMLPIHQKAPSNWSYKDNVNSPTENWNVGYTDNDLFTTSGAGNGYRSWCQEYGESTRYRLLRGNDGVSYSTSTTPSNDNYSYGWRPVLELVR